jgi:NAD(P)-dependent dehydrogenase (short-subunit alcohol dehydrogenase family)|tara:strand:+ start:5827 stop:6336 length:510 start_codon:yes stop_codon:yes gene_type:complete
MRIAITGHKKGIGQEFAKRLAQQGHDIVGISRSDGENIRRVAHTASLIEPCDMFINNAISFYAQTELLFEVWHRWQDSEQEHHIWNISTQVCEWTNDRQINGLTMRQSMEYRNQKMALELAHEQLNTQVSNIKMKLIRPGSVNTQTFSHPDSISVEDFVDGVLKDQDIA